MSKKITAVDFNLQWLFILKYMYWKLKKNVSLADIKLTPTLDSVFSCSAWWDHGEYPINRLKLLGAYEH